MGENYNNMVSDLSDMVSDLSNQLEVYQTQHQYKSGWHQEFGGYWIFTFNGGDSWYALSLDPSNKGDIIGLAEDVYPGILDYCHTWKIEEVYTDGHILITLIGKHDDIAKQIATFDKLGIKLTAKR